MMVFMLFDGPLTLLQVTWGLNAVEDRTRDTPPLERLLQAFLDFVCELQVRHPLLSLYRVRNALTRTSRH